MTKNNLHVPEWKFVENYLKTESLEGAILALFQADKIFEKVACAKKNVKNLREREKAITDTIKELESAESFLKARETAHSARDNIGELSLDLYGAQYIIDIYSDAIREIVFGDINTAKVGSWKYTFWPIYYRFFWAKKKIFKILLWVVLFVVLVLFISDTTMGREAFLFVVGQIHSILKIILIILLGLFAIAFFVALSIVFLESRRTKRRKKR